MPPVTVVAEEVLDGHFRSASEHERPFRLRSWRGLGVKELPERSDICYRGRACDASAVEEHMPAQDQSSARVLDRAEWDLPTVVACDWDPNGCGGPAVRHTAACQSQLPSSSTVITHPMVRSEPSAVAGGRDNMASIPGVAKQSENTRRALCSQRTRCSLPRFGRPRPRPPETPGGSVADPRSASTSRQFDSTLHSRNSMCRPIGSTQSSAHRPSMLVPSAKRVEPSLPRAKAGPPGEYRGAIIEHALLAQCELYSHSLAEPVSTCRLKVSA